MNYKMTLIIDGRELNIPVLPSKLNVSSPGKNEKLTVLETGEILVLRKKGLRTVSWDSFFPANSAPYTLAFCMAFTIDAGSFTCPVV